MNSNRVVEFDHPYFFFSFRYFCSNVLFLSHAMLYTIIEEQKRGECMFERKLYHIDLFMPDRFITYTKEHQSHMTKVKFSRHLLDYFENGDEKHDLTRNGLLASLKRCVLNPVVPFEVEAADIWVKKYVIRASYNDMKDISIAIVCKDYKSGLPFIKTAWLNNKDDIHNTLDVYKYSWNL